TPLICCSIGATTVSATVSALAPGYWPETLMVGGAISGYCATGSRRKATPPRIMITIEMTEAKIGRSMKKCAIFISRSLLVARLRAGGRRRSALLLRVDRHARPDPGEPVHHDRVVGRQTGLDDALAAARELAERQVFRLHLVVGPQHEDELAYLLAADRG